MAKYILKKLIHSFFTVLGVMIITFVLFNVVAGDPSASYVDSKSSKEDRLRWKKNNKVDLPAILNTDSRLQFVDNTKGKDEFSIISKNGLKLNEYGEFLTIYKNDKDLPVGERILDKTSIQSKRMSRSGIFPANEQTLLSQFLPKKSNKARVQAKLISPTPLQLKRSKESVQNYVSADVSRKYRAAYTRVLTKKFSECADAESWFGDIDLNQKAAKQVGFTKKSLYKRYIEKGYSDLKARYDAAQKYSNKLILVKDKIMDQKMTANANEAASKRKRAAKLEKEAKEALENKASDFAKIAEKEALESAIKNGASKEIAEKYAKSIFEKNKAQFLKSAKLEAKYIQGKAIVAGMKSRLKKALEYDAVCQKLAPEFAKIRKEVEAKFSSKDRSEKAVKIEIEKQICIRKYKLIQQAMKTPPAVDVQAEYCRLEVQSKTNPRVPLAKLVARRCVKSGWLSRQAPRKQLIKLGYKIIAAKKEAEAKLAPLKAREIAAIKAKYPLVKNPKTAAEIQKNELAITNREDEFELIDSNIKELVVAEFQNIYKTSKSIDAQAELYDVLATAEATAIVEGDAERKKSIKKFNDKRNLPGLEIKLQDGSDFFVPVTGNETWGQLIANINNHKANAGKLTAKISKFELGNLKYCQFYYHMKNCITFQGRSFKFKKTLQQIIGERAKYSLSLTVPSLALGWILALSLSSIVAYFRGTWIDHSIVFICVIGMCVPFLAYMIIGQNIMFKIAPEHAFGTDDPINVYVPICIGMIAGLGRSVRFYRTVILNEVNQDYVRTARAKGVALPGILFKHVLKNCMLPVITSVVMSIPFLIMGNLLLEKFFGINGLGDLMLMSISSRDVPIITAMTFLTAIVYVVGLLITDILYAVFDPRIRLR